MPRQLTHRSSLVNASEIRQPYKYKRSNLQMFSFWGSPQCNDYKIRRINAASAEKFLVHLAEGVLAIPFDWRRGKVNL